jgi:ribosomal protein S18 acetylase RimI-like enzyme
MSLTISEADLSNPDDARSVLQLLETYAADPMGGNTKLSPEVRATLIPRLQEVESRLVLLAQIDDQPVGVAIAFRSFSTFRAAPVLNLHDLAVHPNFRGRGVGRTLLKHIEAHARQMNCCRVTLEVRRDNHTAQSLYQSEGFTAGDPPQEFWIKPLP